MAVPSTSVLDNFNRADGAPGANWTQAIESYGMPNIASNALDWPQYPSLAWTTSFAADQEVFVKMLGITETSFLLRLNNLNTGAETGYEIRFYPWAGGGAVSLFRMDVGYSSETLIEFTNNIVPETNLYFWATAIGSTISFYGSDDGVSYTLIKSWTEATYSSGGYIGLFHPNNTTVGYDLDDFGGGAIVTVTLDTCLPDADVTTTGWTNTPLFSKINDASDATVIQATAS